MDNHRRQKIIDNLDNWITDWGNISPELFMDVQCEIFNMQEEIEFWIKYSSRLKEQLDDCRSIKKSTTSFSIL